MSTTTNYYYSCPNCHKQLSFTSGDSRVFGPTVIICPECKATIRTSWKNWSEGGTFEKVVWVMQNVGISLVFPIIIFLCSLMMMQDNSGRVSSGWILSMFLCIGLAAIIFGFLLNKVLKNRL
jgi:hypothetical protein